MRTIVKKGFGWSGPYIGNADIMKYDYLSDAPVDELQKSIIYDDYGRTDTFNWDIDNGKYTVTVSIGWQDREYDQNQVIIEGQTLFDSVATTPDQPYQVKSITVDVTDGASRWRQVSPIKYTMLNWMSIEPAQ